jgi:cytochrome c biogenesis protein CcmG, thiol:disulfide interchange protein DsbE
VRLSQYWRPTLALLLLAALLLTGCPAAAGPPKVGQEAPNLTLPRLEGGEVQLTDLRGKVVLLNFWATNCAPCRAEMPAMEKVHQELAASGAVILAVDYLEDPETVRRYVEAEGLTFLIALDPNGSAGKVYGVQYTPTTYVIDREGIIRYKAVGQLEEQVIREYFSSLL